MALHFPFPAVNGDIYPAENGVTYTYDGTKWVGSGTATVNNVSELNRGESQLLLNANGSVQFPNYLFPATDGSYNQILNTDGQGMLSWNDIVADNGTGTGNIAFDGSIISSITDDNIQLTTNNKTWTFGTDGIINLPNNNGQIGQLESPYTGLEFRTGSGADWIGISYGEINDNNTSYFYFDKDGSDYLTANHQAHLQIKNTAHDGHVEWLFESNGALTLPQGTTLGINDSTDGFIIDGAADKDISIYTYGSSTAYGWTFDIDGDLKVPQEIRNPQGHRAIWSNEVPRDISDLTDNSMLLGMSSSTLDINIDGGGAYATYEGTLVRADGGFSGTRWGVNTTVFDGGSGAASAGYTMTLNGGGA